jgi:hypothetical protein
MEYLPPHQSAATKVLHPTRNSDWGGLSVSQVLEHEGWLTGHG